MSYRYILVVCMIGISIPTITATPENQPSEIGKGVSKGVFGGLLHRFGTLYGIGLLGTQSETIYHNFSTPDYTGGLQSAVTSNIAAFGIGAASTRLIDTMLYPTNTSHHQQRAYITTRALTSIAIASYSFMFPGGPLAHPFDKHKQQCASNEIGAAVSTGLLGGNKIIELDGNKLYIGGSYFTDIGNSK